MTGPTATDGKVALSLHDMLAPGRQQFSRQQSEEESVGATKRGFQPYHSRSVPKSENLEAQASKCAGSGTPVRTMMLRNIPNKYVQTTLLEEIDSLGFAGTYDFFYLPMDVHNRSNVGYAFINFVLPVDAERFRKVFSEHRFQRFQSRKVSSVCSAHVQGLDENLRHFENRAVTHARNDQYRPVVLDGSRRVDFEEAVAGAKLRGLQAKRAAAAPVGTAPPSTGPGCTLGQAAEPLAPLATVGVSGARQGLEDAIRTLLTSLPVEPQKGFMAPPPGLGGPLPMVQASAADSIGCDKVGNDIEQLMSLRSLLVERLVEKESQAYLLAGQGRAEAEVAWEEPSYITLSPSPKLAACAAPEAAPAHEEQNRATPRTNGLHPVSSLHQLSPVEPW